MRYLENHVLKEKRFDGTILCCPDGETLTLDQINLLADTPKVVIFHPQMLGLAETHNLLSRRRDFERTTHLYLLDSFFYCRRSYNHIDTEFSPCHRCIGPDNLGEADKLKCIPWPKAEGEAISLIADLADLVAAGAVHLYAQNTSQSALARRHFGDTAVIEQVGLWCDGWVEHFDHFEKHGPFIEERGVFDVVYHGSRDLVKGIGWLLAVADQSPELKYLVPLDRGAADISGPPNVTIKPMRWDEGLFAAIKGAALTVVPSLWSAPCEGALVKSIVTARATGVVDISTAFSSEIPDDVILKLPFEPTLAAAELTLAVKQPWQPNAATLERWAREFRDYSEGMADRIIGSKE